MKKTFFSLILILCMCFTVYGAQLPEKGIILQINNSNAVVNGEFKSMGDISPVLENSRTMLPLRFCAEALEADVSWVEQTKTAVVKKDGVVLEFTIGQPVYKSNGQLMETDAAPVLRNGSAMIPLRVLADSFGVNINWYGDISVVTINIEGDDTVIEEYCKSIF